MILKRVISFIFIICTFLIVSCEKENTANKKDGGDVVGTWVYGRLSKKEYRYGVRTYNDSVSDYYKFEAYPEFFVFNNDSTGSIYYQAEWMVQHDEYGVIGSFSWETKRSQIILAISALEYSDTIIGEYFVYPDSLKINYILDNTGNDSICTELCDLLFLPHEPLNIRYLFK